MSDVHMGSAPDIEISDNVDESLKVLFYLSLFRNEAQHLQKFLQDVKETKNQIKSASDLLKDSSRDINASQK